MPGSIVRNHVAHTLECLERKDFSRIGITSNCYFFIHSIIIVELRVYT